MTIKKKTNMYQDAKFRWNIFVGCYFSCLYCKKSFQAQMKRQKQRCMKCYNYEPHFHPERLHQSLPNTKGDEFIWACSSGDISFAKKEWIEQILERISGLPHKTFFFQTKNPLFFYNFDCPVNVYLGITLEIDRDRDYRFISRTPLPSRRYVDFLNFAFERKIVKIEPILSFHDDILLEWIRNIHPERVYVGYDTKNCGLHEPPLSKTMNLCRELSRFTKVKIKLMRERYNTNQYEVWG